MKTPLPTPPKPFTEAEIEILKERLEFIEQALDQGKIVVAKRPHQINNGMTNKVLTEIKFHQNTDADLVTASGGAMNLLDASYELASYLPDKMPENIAERMCLAHLGSEVAQALLDAIQKPTEPKQ